MKTTKNVERSINLFLTTRAEDFVKEFSIKEFNFIVSLLPTTQIFVEMCSSLLNEFIELEEYRYCISLSEFIKKHTK